MPFFNVRDLVTMNFTGVNKTVETMVSINFMASKDIKAEVDDIGREMLADLRAITPVVTGRLKRSAYYAETEDVNEDSTIQEGSLGYTMPYAPIVEFRRSMLANTLSAWNQRIKDRVMSAGLRSLDHL